MPDHRAGRPRSGRVDHLIQQATRDLLTEGGFDALTMEAVAARAGVAKTTLYRRYPSKAELVFASAIHDVNPIPTGDRGSLTDDLAAVIELVVQSLSTTAAGHAASGILAAIATDESMRQRFRDTFVAAEKVHIKAVLDRAAERGELTSQEERLSADLDLLHAEIVGTVLFRVIYLRERADPAFVVAFAEALAAGLRR